MVAGFEVEEMVLVAVGREKVGMFVVEIGGGGSM